jgi:hypothetical protein
LRIIDEAELAKWRGPGRCEWCGLWCVVREPHHLTARGTGSHKRLDIPINLIALGSSASLHPCHRALEDGNGARFRVLEIVAARENTTPEDIEAVVWCLLRIPKEGRPHQIEREIAGLTESQQRLAWEQLGYAARPLPGVDPEGGGDDMNEPRGCPTPGACSAVQRERELRNLVEDLQADFAKFMHWARERDALEQSVSEWNSQAISDGCYPRQASTHYRPSRLAEKIRAGLDRLRQEV